MSEGVSEYISVRLERGGGDYIYTCTYECTGTVQHTGMEDTVRLRIPAFFLAANSMKLLERVPSSSVYKQIGTRYRTKEFKGHGVCGCYIYGK